MVEELREVESEEQDNGVDKPGEVPEDGEEDGGLLSSRLPLRLPLVGSGSPIVCRIGPADGLSASTGSRAPSVTTS